MTARVTVSLEELVMAKADARGFSLLPRQPVGSLLAGRHASRLRGRGLSFEELRHYHAGDDVRTMDWKATARMKTPYVRVYNEERERPVLLLVDQRPSMFFGSQRMMKSVAAAELAALGAWRALQVGDRVGGLVFNAHELSELRPHRSQSRVLQLFHEIVRMNHGLTRDATDGSVSLNDALHRALQVAKHDHLVVLISDLNDADDQTKQLATRLAAHNDMLVAAVYDPLGAVLQGSPGMVAHDRGRLFPVDGGAAFERAFQEQFQAKLEEWRDVFRSLRVPVLPISTQYPVAGQLRALFGSRP